MTGIQFKIFLLRMRSSVNLLFTIPTFSLERQIYSIIEFYCQFWRRLIFWLSASTNKLCSGMLQNAFQILYLFSHFVCLWLTRLKKFSPRPRGNSVIGENLLEMNKHVWTHDIIHVRFPKITQLFMSRPHN